MRTNGSDNGPGPRLAPAFQGGLGANEQSDYDALADLFLGDRGPDASRAPTGERAPAAGENRDRAERRAPVHRPDGAGLYIEALLMGHLPVLAGPWAGQYAASVAERMARPVGLVRLSGGWGSVELYGGAPAPSVSGATMQEAIRAGRAVAAHWLIRVDTTDELDLLRAVRPDGVTLLTGANEAAVVGGYRALKAAAGVLDAEVGEHPVRLGVAVVGAPAERAAATGDRLARTVSAYLGIELDVSAAIPRLEASGKRRLFEGLTDARPDDLGGWIRTAAAAGHPSSSGVESRGGADVETPADFSEPAAYTGVFIPRATATPPSVQPAELDAERRSTDVLLRAAPASQRETGAASAARALGLTPIPVVCPLEPMVELAMDSSGAAHFVAPHGPRAVESLRAVDAWFVDHGSIVARVDGASGLRPRERTTLHVVTNDARAVRGLLDSSVRAHLRIDGSGVVAPLN